MKKFEDVQKELIIDRREAVSKIRNYSELTFNTIGWILWFVLIRPLVLLALWYISYRFFKYHMFTLEGIDNLEFFGLGAGTVLLIFTAMFVWSRYNAWRFGGLDRRKSCGEAGTAEIANYYKISIEEVEKIKNAFSIKIYFDKTEYIKIQTEDGTEIDALYAPLNPQKHIATK